MAFSVQNSQKVNFTECVTGIIDTPILYLHLFTYLSNNSHSLFPSMPILWKSSYIRAEWMKAPHCHFVLVLCIAKKSDWTADIGSVHCTGANDKWNTILHLSFEHRKGQLLVCWDILMQWNTWQQSTTSLLLMKYHWKPSVSDSKIVILILSRVALEPASCRLTISASITCKT